MYLLGNTKLWWQKRSKEDLNAGWPKVDTWESLKYKLNEQFLTHNKSWIVREELKNLRHEGSKRDYIKTFIFLILDIDNMLEEVRLYKYLCSD